MPELPEVETVRRGLAAHAEGKRIDKVTVRNPNLRQKMHKDFAATLTGLTLKRIDRRAKYLLMHFSTDITCIVHLGMSGSITVRPTDPAKYEKHEHVILHLSDGSVAIYRDPRRFGLMLHCPTAKLATHKLIAHLGPEPLEPEWKAEDLYNAFQTRRAPVKSVIMNQEIVVGVGNIYACEALFASRIHPARPSHKVTKAETTALTKAIRAVLNAAIKSGGSTLRDYVRSSGDAGYFQHHFKVYDHENDPCHRCDTPIASMRQSGRSTYYCPSCQK